MVPRMVSVEDIVTYTPRMPAIMYANEPVGGGFWYFGVWWGGLRVKQYKHKVILPNSINRNKCKAAKDKELPVKPAPIRNTIS